jgi:hypothetical protein
LTKKDAPSPKSGRGNVILGPPRTIPNAAGTTAIRLAPSPFASHHRHRLTTRQRAETADNGPGAMSFWSRFVRIQRTLAPPPFATKGGGPRKQPKTARGNVIPEPPRTIPNATGTTAIRHPPRTVTFRLAPPPPAWQLVSARKRPIAAPGNVILESLRADPNDVGTAAVRGPSGGARKHPKPGRGIVIPRPHRAIPEVVPRQSCPGAMSSRGASRPGAILIPVSYGE